MEIDLQKKWNKIISAKEIYIYGAHVRGMTLKTYIHTIIPTLTIKGFIVEDSSKNPSYVDSIKVYSLDELQGIKPKLVLIATKKKYHQSIQLLLHQYEIIDCMPITPELDNLIKHIYFKNRFEQEHIPFRFVEDLVEQPYKEQDIQQDFHIYMVKSIYDKKLINEMQEDYKYLVPIQAGAELTQQTIASHKDNVGDNISVKNKSYCELTAAYWIWKNDHHKYIGLCHYRRRFVLSEQQLQALKNADVDVILPVPTGCEPSVGENYAQRHRKSDWEIMMKLLKDKYPVYYKTALDIFNGNYYYACNMWIMKNEIYQKFAEWLFEILFIIEKSELKTEDDYQNRYIGFLAERLTTLYFCHHREELKIVHADKIFISD